jgi:hypothetical protein
MAGSEYFAEVPDPLLPSQLSGAIKSGEHRLMFAVLIDAINLACADRDDIESRDAIDWIRSDVKGARFGWSFLDICSELDLDPVRMRQRIEHAGPIDLRGRISRGGEYSRRIVFVESEVIQ